MGKTIFTKIWDSHVLAEREDGQSLLYIDRHLVHELSSPIAFDGLRIAHRRVRKPDLTFAVMDHDIPTGDRTLPINDSMAAAQMKALAHNASEFGFRLFDYFSPFQGIVHVIGPELGLTIPGITLVCGDSHTSTHGAFGALALGIGTSEIEHVLATQTLWFRKPSQMEIRLEGQLSSGVTPKDVILYIIREIGTGGAIGHALEFTGETVRRLSMEERMTLTNMTVEAGARTSIVSPDEKTYAYLHQAPYAPRAEEWDETVRYWDSLKTEPAAKYDKSLSFDLNRLEPQVTWGTNPAMTVGITETIPSAEDFEGKAERGAVERALNYMGLRPGMKVTSIGIDVVFIGSCTNGRLSDLIEAARVVKGKKVAPTVNAIVVPGSQLVKRRAERLGLHRIFMDAGFEWRNSGCSMCVGINEDKLKPGLRSASTSNRNFENRQGPGGRTHLVSPIMAAAAAIEGRFTDVREMDILDPQELQLAVWANA
jgi:3-isopropylmalate/(R)-2-methylmalate dehydratase large subunit